MKRRRSFCRYCGALTSYPDRCCHLHRDLLPLDDPERMMLEMNDEPTNAAPTGEAAEATREKGRS